jgi:spore cortex formation protein SpoVR/YcgB (stage V sporulation)
MTKNKLKEMFSRSDWNEDTILEADKIISRIAKDYLGLDTYTNQFEIVTSEQMLDAYSLVGLPISYNHWKFGKDFVINKSKYRKGRMGLAYELVINSDPCISYNMEDNTTCLMLLVLAHAAYGHNHFFKNNYLFKQWTQADAIVDYMLFARNYVSECEEKYGYEEVEKILDACHMIQRYGVDKYTKPNRISAKEEKERLKKKVEDDRVLVNEIWRTLPDKNKSSKKNNVKRFPSQPEENILYFIEKNSPKLKTWQRELVRIVRQTAQYFYPQGQTKVINEGCATFSHFEIINKMYSEGYLDEGFMIEFLHNHSNVIYQPGFDSNYYSGINPYTLGFNIFMDLKRMALDPTEEDKEWFPEIAGKKDWTNTFKYIVENFKDETFILQYLSPKVIRDMKLFEVKDDEDRRFYEIGSIHNKQGYKDVRKSLSENYNRSSYIPDIQVYDVDINGDRTLTLNYTSINDKRLNANDVDVVVDNIGLLWGFSVKLIEDGDDLNIITISDELF